MAGIRDGRPPREAVGPRAADVPRDAAAPRSAVVPREATGPRPAAIPKARPDPRPLRIAFGFTALATASALATALAAPGGTAAVPAAQTVVIQPDPIPSVRHVIQYVQLKPGETAPPQAVVKQAPAPKPRVVVVTTRQSGTKP